MTAPLFRLKNSWLFIVLAITPLCKATSAAPLATQDTVSTQTATQSNAPVKTDVATAGDAVLDELLSNALHQTERLDALLEELALVSNNCTHLTKDQKTALVKEIRSLRKDLGGFKKISFTTTSPQELYLLLSLNNALSAHLEAALAKGFTELEHFSLETIVTRSIKEPGVTLEKIHRLAQENDTSLTQLEHTAQSVGLTWYNKAYRVFDRVIVQPCQKYHVVQRGGVALGAAAIALGSWWYFTKRGYETGAQEADAQKFVGTRFEHWLRTLLGEAPLWGKITVDVPYAQQSNSRPLHRVGSALYGRSESACYKKELAMVTNEEKLKTLGHLVETVQEHGGAILGAAGVAAQYLWPYARDDYHELSSWFTKKRLEMVNFLKGGAYASKTIHLTPEGMAKEPACTFDDIFGADNAKEVLAGIIQYLITPEKFDQAKITPEKGYLFTGPTRTGKSFMAEAVAGELRKQLRALGRNPDDIKFYPVDATMVFEAGIKRILAFAKSMAPCILFIDEIDLLQLQRAGNSSLLSDFLIGLSNFSLQDPDKQVIILAATNRSENIDDALKRRGRLGVEIRFAYPSYSYRKQFFMHKLEEIGAPVDELNFDSLAEQTCGRSYDDLNGILKKALQQAKAFHCTLDQDLLERAIDSEIFMILPTKDHPLSDYERQLLATSVAGQLLVNHLLDTATIALKATINPYMPKLNEQSPWQIVAQGETKKQDLIKFGKIFTTNKNEFLSETYSAEHLTNICKMLLAGRCAQKLLLGTVAHDTDMKSNLQSSFTIAKTLVGKGVDGTLLSDKMRDSFADKAYALIETFEQEVSTLLTTHKEQLERLVAALLKYETLNRDELSMILDGKHAAPFILTKDTGELTSVIEQPAATA